MAKRKKAWGYNKPFGYVLDTSHPHSQSLIHLWLFNEQSAGLAFDTGPKKNIGVLSGSPTIAPTFSSGPGIVFDGSNRVLLQNSIVAPTWTAEFMICQTTEGTGACRILGAASFTPDISIGGTFGGGFGFVPNSAISIYNGSAWSSFGSSLMNSWRRVTLTYDGTNVRAYLNATLLGSATISVPINGSAVIADYVGHSGATDGNQFIGKVDYIAIWNRPLTFTEVVERQTNPFGFLQSPTSVIVKATAGGGFQPAWAIASQQQSRIIGGGVI